MLKRILIAVSLVAASLSFQTSAQAEIVLDRGFGGKHGVKQQLHHGRNFHKPKAVKKFKKRNHVRHNVSKKHFVQPRVSKKHFVQPRIVKKHKIKKHHVRYHTLSNKELRHHLKAKGLFNIRFIDRYRGVAEVVAHHKRGHIGKYKVSTRNGHILSSRVIRHKRRFR